MSFELSKFHLFRPSYFLLLYIFFFAPSSFLDLCSADPNFHIGVFNASPPDPYFQEVVITPGDHFYFDDSIGRPLTLRVGDYNLDGYPHLTAPSFSMPRSLL
jgi:hypothetical protein